MNHNIDFTKAITAGVINFEQAYALQSIDTTEAIKEGILSFEEACALQDFAVKPLDTAPKDSEKRVTTPASGNATTPEAAAKAPSETEPKSDSPSPSHSSTSDNRVFAWLQNKFASTHPVDKLGEDKYLYRSMLITLKSVGNASIPGNNTFYLDLPDGPAYGTGPGKIPYCRWFTIGQYGPDIDPAMPPIPRVEDSARDMKAADMEQLFLPFVTGYIDRHYNAFAKYLPTATASLEMRYAEEDEEESEKRKAAAATPEKPEHDEPRPSSIFGVFDAAPYTVDLYGNGWVDGEMEVDEAQGICKLKESRYIMHGSHGTDTEYRDTEQTMSIEEALHLLKHRPSSWLSYTPTKTEQGVQALVARLEDIQSPPKADERLLKIAQSFFGGGAKGRMVSKTENGAIFGFVDEKEPHAKYVVKLTRISPTEKAAYEKLGADLVKMTSGAQSAHGLLPVMRADVIEKEEGTYALLLMPNAITIDHPNVYIKSWRNSFERVFPVGYALATGLSTLHQNGYVHMDVKTSNTFNLGKPSDNDWALGDFGSTREMGFVSGGGRNLTWTKAYAAPEVNGKEPCAPTMDVYAWGRAMFELFWNDKIGPEPVAIAVHYEHDSVNPTRKPDNSPDNYYSFNLFNDVYYSHGYLKGRKGSRTIKADYRGYLLTQAMVKAMDPNPAERFADGRELLQELEIIKAATGKQATGELALIGDTVARCDGGQTRVRIPNGTARIFHGAFRKNADVQVVSIPASVTTIGAHAFAQCTALKEVRFEGRVPQIDSTVFVGCNAIEHVTVADAATIYNLPQAMRTLAFKARVSGGKLAKTLCKDNLSAAAKVAQAPHDENPTVNFGSFRWQIIGTRNNRLLLLADSEVGFMPFGSKGEWQNSYLRTYLNGPFLAECFTDVERASIEETTLLTDGVKTKDHVFLLSIEELNTYLPVASQRTLHTTAGKTGPWWLRSKSCGTQSGVGVESVDLKDTKPADATSKKLVRPALWVTYRRFG